MEYTAGGLMVRVVDGDVLIYRDPGPAFWLRPGLGMSVVMSACDILDEVDSDDEEPYGCVNIEVFLQDKLIFSVDTDKFAYGHARSVSAHFVEVLRNASGCAVGWLKVNYY